MKMDWSTAYTEFRMPSRCCISTPSSNSLTMITGVPAVAYSLLHLEESCGDYIASTSSFFVHLLPLRLSTCRQSSKWLLRSFIVLFSVKEWCEWSRTTVDPFDYKKSRSRRWRTIDGPGSFSLELVYVRCLSCVLLVAAMANSLVIPLFRYHSIL